MINVESASELLAMLVSPPRDVVAADDNTAALGGILSTLFVLVIIK